MNEWIVNIFCGPCIIESLTYKLITQTSQVKWIEFAVICWLAEMRLVGYSDWSSEEAMTVYIDDAALKNTEKLPHIHLAISDHVGTLYQHLFLANKPSRPSQSRWTGVANVCEFALSLSLCHGFLKGLFASLKKKQDGKDKDKDGTGANHDADVRSSVACFSMECMNEWKKWKKWIIQIQIQTFMVHY